MSLDSDCLARLKLRQAPFDTLASEDFLYSDPLLESLVETAARAIGAPGAVVVLAGPDGSGRSVQLMRLLGVLEGSYELIAFRSRPNIPFDAVDVTIRAHLRRGGFDNPNRPVAELLAERARAQARLVLAIDDAHLLGREGLVKLVRLRATVLEAGGQGMRLILVGDPSLSRERLPLPDLLDDAQVVRLNLRPFNLEQAGAYLRHRLRVAGLEDPDSLLTRGDIAVLQGSAKGLPAALNAQANAWLARRCKSLEGGDLRNSLGGRSTTAKAAGTIQSQVGAEARRPPEPFTEPDLLAERLELSEEFLELKPDTSVPSASSAPAPSPPREPQLSDFLIGGEVPTALAQSEFEQILQRVRQHQPWDPSVPEPKAATREQIKAAAPKPKTPYWNRPWFIPLILVFVLLAIAAPVLWQLMIDSKPSTSLRERSKPIAQAASERHDAAQEAAKPESQSLAPEPAQAEATPVSDSTSAAVADASEPDDGASKSQATPNEGIATSETSLASEASPDVWAEDLAWLMRQDPERFTIQLVAARDLQTARRVLDPQALEGVHYIQTRSYVIAVLGSFPNRTQAARELPRLPASVRNNGPWIRTIGSIRDSLP
ncbi:AAA family ATPase [Thermochromatium tepidum]|uniref:Sporulation protein n=1 Tax=Thermochromatium tepidum ATCC 43061 TaxID=316276 RepID=A0A6I6E7U0_THETI|nr:AAA family ATPase [Thermochromatium tepidum]QGU32598.1 sporulation protein [Thermochromatium tepidum ATCC 43061]